MSRRLFLGGITLLVVASFAYFFGRQAITSITAHAASNSVPDMVPSKITFSEIATVQSLPEQHAVRVIAYKRDHSMSDTYFWTHGTQTHGTDLHSPFNREMWLYRRDGYFKIEVYSETNSKITFPGVPEMVLLKRATGRDPNHDCLQTYADKSAMSPNDRFVGKQKLFLPGAGLVDAVMTTMSSTEMTLTSWFAPSLGCAEVQHIGTFPQTDGTVGVNAMYPISVSLGDPSEDLFSDGGAQEVDPFEAIQRKTRAAGLAANRSQSDIADRESKALSGAVAKAKEERYQQAWALFRAGKARP